MGGEPRQGVRVARIDSDALAGYGPVKPEERLVQGCPRANLTLTLVMI